MNIIVVGCGKLGAELAFRLFRRSQSVTIIDRSPGAFDNLPSDFQGRMCEGEALNRDVLHRAGIENTDALAAVTNSDSVNAVIGYIAQSIYGVGNVVVRNYNPNCRSIFEAFGLQVISSTSWGAQRLEEMIYHSDIRAIFSPGNGEVEIYEMVIPEYWNNKKIVDLLTTDDCIAVSLTHAGISSMPSSEAVMKMGDILHISTTFEGIEQIRSRLQKKG